MIDFKNVTKTYEPNITAVRDMNLHIDKGEFVFVIGHSGAGKSTFLKLMLREEKATKGEVMVNGYNLTKIKEKDIPYMRRTLGVVFQDFRLLEHLSAFDNVALPLRICGMNEREVKKRVTELLQWVELDRNMYAKTSTLSGGEKQRTAIARAVINRPDLLLADEPTGNVDNDIAPKLMKLFVELNKLGTTVVIATHSEKLITDFAFPRLHLQNHGLKVYEPYDFTGINIGNRVEKGERR